MQGSKVHPQKSQKYQYQHIPYSSPVKTPATNVTKFDRFTVPRFGVHSALHWSFEFLQNAANGSPHCSVVAQPDSDVSRPSLVYLAT